MTGHKSILVSLFWIYVFSLQAQQPIIKSYTLQDGLVTNQVRKIFQDSKGSIWIGTLEGISQFNGHQFINYTTSEGLSNSVAQDFFEIDGKILVALNDGTICAIQNGKINTIAKSSSEISVFTSFLKLPDGRLISSTGFSGIYEYRNGTFFKPKQQYPDLGFSYIVQYNDTLIVAPTSAGKLALLSNDYRIIADTTFPFVFNSIYKDLQQRVWLCTNKGLFMLKLDKDNKMNIIIDLPDEFKKLSVNRTNVFSFLETADGEFWIGTLDGLIRVARDKDFKIYTDKDGLAHKYIYSIFCDREKNIWTGTIEGISRIVRQNDIQNLQTIGGSNEKFIGLMIPWKKNALLLMTYGKPLVYDNNSNGFSEFKFNSKESPICFFPGTHPLLYSTFYSLGYVDSIQNKAVPLKTDSFISADPHPCVDKDGHAFLNSSSSVIIISGKKVWMHKSPSGVTCLTLDQQGYLWAGTWNTGLYRIKFSFTKDSILSSVKDFSYLLTDNSVRSLFTDSKGNIWVGSRYKGAFRLTSQKNGEYAVTAYSQKNGLTSDFARSFAESPNGDIWIGSLSGLDKLIKERNGYRVFNFSRVNNLSGSFFSMVHLGNDEWICNVNNKLVKFTDDKLENTAPLKVEISVARLGGVKDSISFNRTDTLITLRHFQNQASFEFSAPSFINEKQIHYSYRLLGSNDTTWSEPRNIHQVSFASLQPGYYIFEVRTIGWNNQPGEITKFFFTIKLPFWKTWWFILLAASAFLFIVYLLYRYRIRQLQRLQQVRNRIATDLHDDIGSTLTNISILTELSKRNKEKPEKTETYLDRISEEIDASGQALDDIIWSVNSKNDTIQEMAARMRRYAAELLDAQNTHYELTLDPLIVSKKITMELRRDLYLIFKESLNNIYKHASATAVLIDLFVEKENIIMIIADNGKGFDTAMQTHRNGVANIKERVKKWEGSIDLRSGSGSGTTIKVSLPLSGTTQKRD